jgi:hypothetical protein
LVFEYCCVAAVGEMVIPGWEAVRPTPRHFRYQNHQGVIPTVTVV